MGSNYSIELCKHIFKVYFEQQWNTFHTHEMTATNDCFTNFKYEYEFVTNYDFDELIFPRKHPTYDVHAANRTCEEKSSSPTPIKYSIYDFATRMFEIHKDLKQPVGAIHLEHMLFVDTVSNRFLNQLSKEFDNNETSRLVEFPYETKRLNLKVLAKEFDPKYVYQSRLLIKCLNKSMGDEDNLRKWNRVYALWISVRHGKSIYNTNLSEFVNQHYAEMLSPGAKWIRIPLDQGFSSHFRDPVDNNFFLGQNYSLRDHFRIDLEYYHFLADHASRYYGSFLRNFFNF